MSLEPKSGNQAKRGDLYAEGLCRDCEAQLLDEELATDARRCGVCRAVAALRKAKKRDRTRSPQEINSLYQPRIEAEQAKHTRAGAWPETGSTRDGDGAPVPCERSGDNFYLQIVPEEPHRKFTKDKKVFDEIHRRLLSRGKIDDLRRVSHQIDRFDLQYAGAWLCLIESVNQITAICTEVITFLRLGISPIHCFFISRRPGN